MWWMWALVLAFVLFVVEIVVGTVWLWHKVVALLSDVERTTSRLDELAHVLEDLDATAGKESMRPDVR